MAESRKAPTTTSRRTNNNKKEQQFETQQILLPLICSECSDPTSVQCASNYDTDEICCNQPGTPSTTVNQCPVQYPACLDYVFNSQWGTCVSNPLPADDASSAGTLLLLPMPSVLKFKLACASVDIHEGSPWGQKASKDCELQLKSFYCRCASQGCPEFAKKVLNILSFLPYPYGDRLRLAVIFDTQEKVILKSAVTSKQQYQC